MLAADLLLGSIPDLADYRMSEKTDYRGAGRWLMSQWRDGDITFYETLLPEGRWEPHLFGGGLYFDNDIPQLSIVKLAQEEAAAPTLKRRIWLFLHELAQSNTFPKDRFLSQEFHELTIVRTIWKS